MAPKTRMIGDVEVPMPMRKEPEKGSKVYILSLVKEEKYTVRFWKVDSPQRFVENGLVFETREDAIANANAILALTSGRLS